AGEAAMTAKCVFVAFADHGLSKPEHDFFSGIIKELRDYGYTVYHRINYGMSDGEIVTNVRESLQTCDYLVDIVIKHSFSVGWETGWAQGRGLKLKMLCLHPKDVYVTRTITGLAQLKEVTLWDYEREKDILPLLHKFIEEH